MTTTTITSAANAHCNDGSISWCLSVSVRLDEIDGVTFNVDWTEFPCGQMTFEFVSPLAVDPFEILILDGLSPVRVDPSAVPEGITKPLPALMADHVKTTTTRSLGSRTCLFEHPDLNIRDTGQDQ